MDTKTCSRCSETKPTAEFPRKKSSRDGLNGLCHVCNRAHVKAWRLAHPDKKRQMDLDWRLANPERKREKNREWYQNNRERHAACGRRWAEENRDKTRAAVRGWAEKYPEKIAAKVRKRQAALLNRCALLTPEKEAQIVALYAEAQRLSKEMGIPHHVDHVIPLRGKTVSGLHLPENMQIIPAADNLRKGTKVDLAETLFPASMF